MYKVEIKKIKEIFSALQKLLSNKMKIEITFWNIMFSNVNLIVFFKLTCNIRKMQKFYMKNDLI